MREVSPRAARAFSRNRFQLSVEHTSSAAVPDSECLFPAHWIALVCDVPRTPRTDQQNSVILQSKVRRVSPADASGLWQQLRGLSHAPCLAATAASVHQSLDRSVSLRE